MEPKIGEKHVSSREKPLEKLAFGVAAAKGKRKKTVEIAHSGQEKVNALGIGSLPFP